MSVNINKKRILIMSKAIYLLIGAVTGAANGLFGAGGGMLAVPMLEYAGYDAKSAHSTSIAITMPLSIVSTVIYSLKSQIDFELALKFIPFGLLGAYVGARLLKKVTNKLLSKAFAVILIISGLRLIFR